MKKFFFKLADKYIELLKLILKKQTFSHQGKTRDADKLTLKIEKVYNELRKLNTGVPANLTF